MNRDSINSSMNNSILFRPSETLEYEPKKFTSKAHKCGQYFFKNSRFFRMNFEAMLVVSDCNKINVLTAREFTIIDILYGHNSPIKCLDISPFTKDIISFSKYKLILHRIREMPDNPNYFADNAILTTALSWEVVWERNLALPITCLRFSIIGDFFVATGNEVLNLWKREKLKPSFKSEVFLCINKELAIPSRSTEILNSDQLGDILISEITVDGRYIITLEKDKLTLKIWYNNFHKFESKIERTNSQKIKIADSQFQTFDDDSSDSNSLFMKQNKAKVIHDSNEIKLHSHSKFGENKNVQLLNREDIDDDKDDPVELEYYSLLNHNSKIVSFKLMMPDLFEGYKNAIPTALATITEKGWIFLWYENLMDKNISFMCAHVFKPEQNEIIHDMAFLDFPPIDPRQYHALKAK